MNEISLLIIVVTYNGMKWLDKCLSSVVNSSIDADLFIVDNGSTDGSIEFIQQNYPKARLIMSKENLGFGKANNLGLQYAIDNNYDFVYLLNQDAWVEDDTFEKMIAIQELNPQFGILSPLQVNRDKNRLDKAFASCCCNDLLSDCLMQQPLKIIYSTDFVMAAHWLISKECLITVGGFSPVFPHYGEDDNYIHRTIYHRFKIGIVPDTIGVHDREHRERSIKSELHKYVMTWTFTMSNPSERLSKRLFKLSNSVLYCFHYYKLKSLPYFAKFILRIPQIARYRKLSKFNGAFVYK